MNLTSLVETLARPGLLGLIGQQSEKRLQQALEAYFRVLGRKVVALDLPSLAHSHESKLVKHAVKMRLHNTLRITKPLLQSILEAGIKHAMLATNNIHHFAEAEGDPVNGDYVLASDIASEYASQYAGELVTGINDTTQNLIADAIKQGIDDQLGVQGTASLLSSTLDSMTSYRSQMIATTEMNNAMSEGMLQKLTGLGIEYKQWITATQCCDECAENEDESPIPIDEDFSSGDARPPAHPLCRCAIAGAAAPSL